MQGRWFNDAYIFTLFTNLAFPGPRVVNNGSEEVTVVRDINRFEFNPRRRKKYISTKIDRILYVSNEMSRLSVFRMTKRILMVSRRTSFQYLSFCFCWKKVKWSQNAWDIMCPVYNSALCRTNWTHKKVCVIIEVTRVSSVVGSLNYIWPNKRRQAMRELKTEKKQHESAKKTERNNHWNAWSYISI